MKTPTKFKTLWLPLTVFAALVIVFYKAVDRLPDVFNAVCTFLGYFSPIVVALIIAFILYIPQNKIESLFKKLKSDNFFNKHSRGLSVLITYLVLIIILGALLYFIVPAIVSSVATLIKNIPTYYNESIKYIKHLGGADGKIWGVDVSHPERWISLDKILSYFDISSFGKYIEGVTKFGNGFLNFLLSVVMSVYMLCSHEHLIVTFGKVLNLVFKKRTLYAVYSYIARGCEIFYDYLYGAFLDAIIVSIELSIAFSIIKIPYAILIGIFIGLCNLIPYFGAIISCIVALRVIYITTGNFATVVIAFAIILVLQQIDANLVQPRVIGKSVGVKPFYVVIAITLGGAMFGFVGILVSVPVTAFIRMLILDIMEAKKERALKKAAEEQQNKNEEVLPKEENAANENQKNEE